MRCFTVSDLISLWESVTQNVSTRHTHFWIKLSFICMCRLGLQFVRYLNVLYPVGLASQKNKLREIFLFMVESLSSTLNFPKLPNIWVHSFNFQLAGEAFLPHKSGTLSSSLCTHQHFHTLRSCQPRIPRAPCLCGFDHRLLRRDVGGANYLICCQFLYTYRL